MAEQTIGTRPHRRRRLSRAEKKAKTRAALLEAAARIFGRGGFYGASVEEIAEVAGYSRGAVYSNFESKEDLFMTLLEERDQEWAGAISNLLVGEEQIESALLKGGTVVAELHERNRDWWLLFFELGTYASRDRILELRMAAMYAQARARVAQMIDARCKELKISLPMSAMM
jgi:AcrR family transcriptional regulator